jgi:anti-sigma-K factor RskA
MIPKDRDELHTLAGEYVLGVLDPPEARAIETALASNSALRSAVAFWEEHLHPLSALAPSAEPPADLWDGIAARLDDMPAESGEPRWWNRPTPWRWASAGLAAVAAALILYIVEAPLSLAPNYVAILHAPQQDQASWVATIRRGDLTIRTVATASAPADRNFELWAIGPGTTQPQSLGVIPANGTLHLSRLPAGVRDGTTLAISVEPPCGSPTKQPTGPVVFVGTLAGV